MMTSDDQLTSHASRCLMKLTMQFALFCGLAAAAMGIPFVPATVHAQASHAARARVAVIGQPDSVALRLSESIRTALRQSADSASLDVLTMRDVATIVDEGYRAADSPIAYSDMRVVATLLRADILVGVTPDSGAASYDIVASLAAPVRGEPHVIGRWPTRDLATTSRAIVNALRTDSLYLRALARGH